MLDDDDDDDDDETMHLKTTITTKRDPQNQFGGSRPSVRFTSESVKVQTIDPKNMYVYTMPGQME